ncbi:MAG TPA: hypothetical protein VFJ95_00100, partial [Gammaproteobacteria bacterium]|nr:hypothetical protein [Gammaproteobacteria bacterium]
MISIVRRSSYSVIGAFALAAAALAQPNADRARQIAADIAREQAEHGPTSKGLIGPLSDLAALYRDSGDDALAATAIERLITVIRANKGVLSLDQVTPLEQLIAIEEARGDAEAAWDLDQRLLTLARRHPDDARTVPILHAAAKKRIAILDRYLTGEKPPQIELGCYGGWPRNRSGAGSPSCVAGSRTEIARAVTSDAQRNYAEAIAVLLHDGQYASAELRELESGILATVYPRPGGYQGFDEVDTGIEPWRSWAAALGALTKVTVPNPTGLPLKPGLPPAGQFDYLLGRESEVRLFAYELAAPAPLPAQIEAF